MSYPKPVIKVRFADGSVCNACGAPATFIIVVGSVLVKGEEAHTNDTPVCKKCMNRLHFVVHTADKPHKTHTMW